MKHILLKSALCAVAGLALGAPLALSAQTATSMTTSTTTTSTKVKKTEYHGMVKSVDTAANTITVTNKKGDMTLSVTPTTKIMQNKKPATLADITMGEKVSGSYIKDATGAMMAASIHGKSAPASTTMAAPAMAPATTNAAPSTP
jgi:hypothetical protein